MKRYLCDTCHFVYDEFEGDIKNGVPPYTPLTELSGSLCNRCHIKNNLEYSTMFTNYQELEAAYYTTFSGV